MNFDVSYSDTGRVDYLKFINNPAFKQMKYAFKLQRSLISKEEFDSLITVLEENEAVIEPQKIIIEDLIYLDDFDIFIYTTSCPQTSIIYISSSKKRTDAKISKKNVDFSAELFVNKLLARLEGHKSNYPPTILYCQESGCLISGDKLEKKFQMTHQTQNPLS